MKLRKELWFGFSLMAIIIVSILVFTPWGHLTNGHLGLIMLALIVVAIMLGYPTAFTLMGLGVFFAWLAYRSVNPDIAMRQTLDLMVQRGLTREAFGKKIAHLGGNMQIIAQARCEIEAMRLMVLKAAKAMDVLDRKSVV